MRRGERSDPVKIAYFVHGNGRGHAVRALSLVPALRAEGHDVRLFAGGVAVELLGDLGCVEIDSFGPGPNSIRRFSKRVRTDWGLLRKLGPPLLVTDGDAPSLHAAASLRIPRIALGHGLMFAHCRLPVSLPWRDRAYEGINAASASWLANRIIVVHFGELYSFDPRVVVAQPDPRTDLAPHARRDETLLVYAGQADLSGYVRALHGRGHRLRVFGRGGHMPAEVAVEAPDREGFAAAFRSCRGVVGTAGSNLIAEAAALGRPLLIIASPHMIEQQVNARLAERDGLGVAAPADRVDLEAIERFEALLGRDMPRRSLQTPTVREALLESVRQMRV